MSKPIVVSLGELLWDMLPTGKRAGGAPVNFIYHATRNGTEGIAVSAVGEDQLGDELVDAVQGAGIDSLVQRNAWPTSTVEVMLKSGVPEYTIVRNVAWDHIVYTRELIEAVQKADAVCFGTLGLRSSESHDTIIELLKHTKPTAMKFFDINLRGDHYSKELIEELLGYATVFKINDAELLLRDMFDIRNTSDDEACRWFLTTYNLDYVILTGGSTFSTIIAKTGESSTISTPYVEVADTVGAGDSFSGTFAAKILTGNTMAEAHRAASEHRRIRLYTGRRLASLPRGRHPGLHRVQQGIRGCSPYHACSFTEYTPVLHLKISVFARRMAADQAITRRCRWRPDSGCASNHPR